MTLAAGDRLGPCEILSALGAGGMGETAQQAISNGDAQNGVISEPAGRREQLETHRLRAKMLMNGADDISCDSAKH